QATEEHAADRVLRVWKFHARLACGALAQHEGVALKLRLREGLEKALAVGLDQLLVAAQLLDEAVDPVRDGVAVGGADGVVHARVAGGEAGDVAESAGSERRDIAPGRTVAHERE